jgi:hypothetical protein
VDLALAENPPLGAPAIYRQLTAWQAQLRGENEESQAATANTSSAH